YSPAALAAPACQPRQACQPPAGSRRPLALPLLATPSPPAYNPHRHSGAVTCTDVGVKITARPCPESLPAPRASDSHASPLPPPRPAPPPPPAPPPLPRPTRPVPPAPWADGSCAARRSSSSAA